MHFDLLQLHADLQLIIGGAITYRLTRTKPEIPGMTQYGEEVVQSAQVQHSLRRRVLAGQPMSHHHFLILNRG